MKKIMSYGYIAFALALLLVSFSQSVQAVTDRMFCYEDYSSDANFTNSISYGTSVNVIYNETVQANTSVPITLQNLSFTCGTNSNPPETCPTSSSGFPGSLEITAPLSMSPATGNLTTGSYSLSSSWVIFNSSVTDNFTTPSQAGVYSIVGLCTSGGTQTNETLTYTVTAPAFFQCNDSLNNDSTQGADSADPQCHSDCNVNNPGSYVPTWTSETTPPNGTCPAPTITINAHPASIFQSIVAFFTREAVAQESQVPAVTSEVKNNNIIANVNIYGGAIKETKLNTIEAGFTIKSDLGTQGGVLYGLVLKKKGTQEVVDSVSAQELLTLKFGEYVYKTLEYTSPATINGEYDVYLEVTTDSDIPLSTKKLGSYTFTKSRDTKTFIKECTFDTKAFTATCVIGNTDKVSPTDVLLVLDTRKGGNLGVLSNVQQALSLTFDDKGLATIVTPLSREDGLYALDITVAQSHVALFHNTYQYRIGSFSEVKIDSVFVEQSDKKTFSIGVISLAYSKETNTVTASLLRKGKTLSESSIPFVSPRTDVPLTYKGFSQPDEVLVTISKDDGTVLAQKSTPYVSPFEKKNAGTGWGAIIILAIVAIGYIVSLLRRKV